MTIRAPHLSGRTDRKVQAPQAVPSLLVTTLAVAVVVNPFFQTEWPQPEPLPTQQPFQVGMPLGILEDAGDKPFLLSDWPVQRNDALFEVLQVGASIRAIQPPFFQTNWPQPPPKPTLQLEQIPKSIALVETAVQDPFFQTEWPQFRAKGIHLRLQISRSLTTLPKPFEQSDWPNPQIELTQEPLQFSAPLVLLEAVVVEPPFFQTEWPNPQTEPVQEPVQLGLPLGILQDAGEKPFLQTEWPQPAPAPTVQLEQIPKSISLVEAVVVNPFFQTDWSIYRTEALFEVLQTGQAIRDIAGTPFFQTEWPNPTVEIQIQTPFQVGMSLGILQDAGEKPFDLTEWPQPLPVPTFHVEQISKSIALVEAVAGDPFTQTDWPNPVLPIALQQLEQIPKSIALALFKPASQQGWPQPAPIVIQTPVQVGTILPLEFTEAEPPFIEEKWYVPPAKPTQQPFQVGIPLGILQIAPFAQTEWPNPKIDTKVQTPFQVGSPITLLEDAGEKPFEQSKWPQPLPIPTVFLEQVPVSVALEERPPTGIAKELLLRLKTIETRFTLQTISVEFVVSGAAGYDNVITEAEENLFTEDGFLILLE